MRTSVASLQPLLRATEAMSPSRRLAAGVRPRQIVPAPPQSNALRRPAFGAPRIDTSDRAQRQYSSYPNQNQVIQTFAPPFVESVSIIFQIARIIVFTGVGIAVAGASAYGAIHLYVEFVGLKKDADRKTNIGTSLDDAWGWSSELEEEAWVPPGGGSDPRLGLAGKHALRSAWMATYWTSGGAASPMLSSDDASRSGLLATEQTGGSASAEYFLVECLQIAEDKGIRLPDIAALRAGLKNSHESGADAPLDQTALILETRLAACRERIGSPATLPLAIAGYERIYDALAAVYVKQEAVGHSNQPAVSTNRLVRLATKLGNLNAEVGHREEAEAWLLKAITLAGQGHHLTTSKKSLLEEVTGVAGEDAVPAASKGWLLGWGHSAPRSAQNVSDTSPPKSENIASAVTPTPALTRSFVSTLLSLSGIYASPRTPGETDPRGKKWRAGLEQALHIQASALRLIRLELSRVETEALQQEKVVADQMSASSRELHSLWLKNSEAMVSLHLAETIYALNRTGSRAADSIKTVFTKTGQAIGADGSDAGKGKYGQSIDCLLHADLAAQSVQSSLLEPRALSSKAAASQTGDDKQSGPVLNLLPKDLKDQWKGHARLRVPAERLLRNSGLVRAEVKGMLNALLRKGDQ